MLTGFFHTRAYTIISSRVLLNIKDVLAVRDVGDGTVQMDTIRFITEGTNYTPESDVTSVIMSPDRSGVPSER